MARTGSLLQTIDELNVRPRGLRDMVVSVGKGEIEPVWATDLIDPGRPFRPFRGIRRGVDAVVTRLMGIFV